MKTLTPSRSSWYWKLTARFWNEYWLREDDFCGFARKLGLTLLMCLVIAIVALSGIVLVACAEAAFFWWAILSIISWSNVYTEKGFLSLAFVGIVINSIGAIIGFGYLVIEGHCTWLYSWIFKISCDKIPMCPETRDFLSHAYEAVHNKMCFKMKWKD